MKNKVLNYPTFPGKSVKYIIDRLSEETITLSLWFIDQANVNNNHIFNRICIHVCDCIQVGTITPMEGYNIKSFVEKNKYFPEWVKVRESNFSHTI